MSLPGGVLHRAGPSAICRIGVTGVPRSVIGCQGETGRIFHIHGFVFDLRRSGVATSHDELFAHRIFDLRSRVRSVENRAMSRFGDRTACADRSVGD
jgi:hypothetical protein